MCVCVPHPQSCVWRRGCEPIGPHDGHQTMRAGRNEQVVGQDRHYRFALNNASHTLHPTRQKTTRTQSIYVSIFLIRLLQPENFTLHNIPYLTTPFNARPQTPKQCIHTTQHCSLFATIPTVAHPWRPRQNIALCYLQPPPLQPPRSPTTLPQPTNQPSLHRTTPKPQTQSVSRSVCAPKCKPYTPNRPTPQPHTTTAPPPNHPPDVC